MRDANNPFITGRTLRDSRGPFRFLRYSVALTTATDANVVGLVVDIPTAKELMQSTREDARRFEMRDAVAVVITDEWADSPAVGLTGRVIERIPVWPVPFTCVLCGQRITDGKPCGCGARKS